MKFTGIRSVKLISNDEILINDKNVYTLPKVEINRIKQHIILSVQYPQEFNESTLCEMVSYMTNMVFVRYQ